MFMPNFGFIMQTMSIVTLSYLIRVVNRWEEDPSEMDWKKYYTIRAMGFVAISFWFM